MSLQNLICLFQKCRQEKDHLHVRLLHAFLCERDLETHGVLGNYLVPALVVCGSLPDAQHVFDRLACRNEHSWTALASGYTGLGDLHHAFSLYHEMQEDSVRPSRHMALGLLTACARLKDVERGRIMHTDTVVAGLDEDHFIGNTIVDMYGKCGCLMEAQHTFEKLPARDEVSWNVLISAYSEYGHGEEAISCFQQMKIDHVAAHAPAYGEASDAVGASQEDHQYSYTYVALLKACIRTKDIQRGESILADVIKKGLDCDSFIGTTLVDMYAKCGLLAEARQLFGKLPGRDVFAWNALTAGYADHGFCKEALICLNEMQLEGKLPDPLTFICCLKACSTIGALETGQLIHAETTKMGTENDSFLSTALVDMYAKCGLSAEALHLFDQMLNRDVVAWTAMILGYVKVGLSHEALKYFELLELERVSPDVNLFACGLKACGSTGAICSGQKFHAKAAIRGLETELYLGTTLVDMYAKCGFLLEAKAVFDRLPVRDAASWASLMSGYADYGFDEEVLKCFGEMQQGSVPLDALIFICCLKSCGALGALETGREVHDEIRKSGLEKDIVVGNMLIDMYGKCGSVAEGREVFDKLPIRDVVSWNAMIKVYGENHESRMAVQCYEEMQAQHVKPDAITFICLLAVCSHASLIAKGQEFFKVMREKHNIEPMLDHLTCMVDLLARSGQVHEAERFAEAMQCFPPNESLRALLTACKVYGKVEQGQTCFGQLLQLSQQDAAAYLLLADIYTTAGRSVDANQLEIMRKDAGAKKKAAVASLEVNEKVYDFVVGQNQSKHIASLHLETWFSCIRCEGFVPRVDLVS